MELGGFVWGNDHPTKQGRHPASLHEAFGCKKKGVLMDFSAFWVGLGCSCRGGLCGGPGVSAHLRVWNNITRMGMREMEFLN